MWGVGGGGESVGTSFLTEKPYIPLVLFPGAVALFMDTNLHSSAFHLILKAKIKNISMAVFGR